VDSACIIFTVGIEPHLILGVYYKFCHNNVRMFIFRLIENDMDGKSRFGVMPRFGDAESIIWFDVKNHCSYHLFNCFEDGNEVIPIKSKYTMTDIYHHNPNFHTKISLLWMK
jgi:carotenoid cleavage dioxygenase-like enzyme